MNTGRATPILSRMAAGGGVGALTLPIFVNGTGTTVSGISMVVGGVLVASLLAGWVRRMAVGRALVGAGGLLVVVAAVALNATPNSPLVVFESVGLGIGVGLIAASVRDPDRRAFLGFVEGLVALALAATFGPDAAPFVVGGVLGLLGAAAALTTGETRPGDTACRSGARVMAAVGAVSLAALVFWVGSNDPAVAWFGPQIVHGSRHVRAVAVTFDDGPNAGSSLRIAHVLDSYGAKGAFFTVGKALDRRPDISKALLADGQLLGNHSYHHDQWRWLDPRYPELDRTEAAFKRDLGVCPALYRPPHGERTWFISHLVASKHMKLVLWDDSAGDWATNDAHLVASRILRKVKPGSVILLHDGLDGNVTANRSVVVRALPLILDGLRSRHLRVERLDRLLGVRPYRKSC